MNFFEVTAGETIRVAETAACCIFFAPRSVSFELGESTDDGAYRQTGWIAVHWSGDADSGLVHLRFAVRPSVATIRFTNELRDELYGRLGIPERTPLKQDVMNFDHVVEIYDTRGPGCFVNQQIEWEGEKPDFLNSLLFEPPFLPGAGHDDVQNGG